MLATLAIATALSLTPAQDSELKLSNPRTTYGFLGSPRENAKYLPGDVLFLAFDIKGMTVGKQGEIKYSLALDMKNAAGAKVFGQLPQVIESANSVGGNQLPGYAYADIGGSVPAGKYTLTVTVRDEIAKKSEQLTHQFEVLKKDFGIGRLGLFYDDRGGVWAPPVFVVGQSAWLHFWTMGFDRDGKTKDPNVEVRMRILDESGKPTLPQPITGDLKNQKLAANAQFAPWLQKVELNRPGKFKIELEAEDKVSKKTVKEVLSITVLESK
jgi:hypothetical protein